ncbi:translation initiation factor IF-3 [Candidatus Contubernalis alkalaceticus]|nr:translation initiation factor IF-3 [Candidatus Contubernalis alkalaceticus]UNC93885.1 translation initiation factor IF-3 [Candidatus Contubernalis alkalaceticus]
MNEQIRAKEVRLIDSEGEQMGIVPLKEALNMAREKNLDLVNVAPNAKPPVCRIMDYGKYKYEQSKREKEARKNQKIITVKEVKVRPNIEDHDLNVKVRNAKRFLENEDKVKVTVMFRGREITHSQLGKVICDRIAEELKDYAVVEKKARVEGRNMIMILTPIQNRGDKNAKNENP